MNPSGFYVDPFLGMEYTENADFLYFFREIRVFRA